jgi:hypothetical protein
MSLIEWKRRGIVVKENVKGKGKKKKKRKWIIYDY